MFLKEFYDVVIVPVANDTVGLLIRQFSHGMIDTEYLKKDSPELTPAMEKAFQVEARNRNRYRREIS